METDFKVLMFFSVLLFAAANLHAQDDKSGIYHDGWVDFNKNGKQDVFEDPSKPVEIRVQDLLAQMTLEEKTCQTATLYGYGRVLKDKQPTPQWKNEIWKDGIANIDEQLNGVKGTYTFIPNEYTYPHSAHATAINNIQRWFVEETRLGIPVDFSNEGIHGLTHDRATPLPSPIAIGSTWNKQLVYQAGMVVGHEAKALGYTNIYAPILDVARDPRWGRTIETYGENPFHIAELGIQMTRGIQSQGVASTLKHFAVYGIPKGGRDGTVRTDPHVAPREMFELHLYPFRRVIREGGAMGVMSSYNDWNGEPVTGSHYFLTELLRRQFGFKGYVVSDSRAVEFIESKHKVAGSYKEAVRQAIEAGLNVRTSFSPPEDFILPLRELVKEGKLSMQTLDSRVADVLRVKFQLGLFDQPYVAPKQADAILNPANTRDLVLDMARQSLVLLKNKNNVLPLDIKKVKTILVTGPMAAETAYLTSRYGPSNLQVTSILEGIKQYTGAQATVRYARGCEVVDKDWPESEIIETRLTPEEVAGINSAVVLAKQSDVIIAVMGEDEHTVGESLSRSSLDLPGRQEELLRALAASGKPVILILVNGRPLSINWADKYVDGIVETWFSNSMIGRAVAETVFGDYNPGGRLPITFPKTVGQIEFNFPYKRGSQTDQAEEGKDTQVHGALYPFGFGLSYTTFAYRNLSVSPKTQNSKDNITVSVEVSNTGSRKGDEVVQLYLKDEVSSVTTYEYDLRGFERISLIPGESRTVQFTLRPDDMALLDKNNRWTVEPGEFEVMVGGSSADIKLKSRYTIRE